MELEFWMVAVLVGTAVIGIGSHLFFYWITKGYSLQVLKSVLATEGAWYLRFTKQRRVKLSFMLQIPEQSDQVVLGIPLDSMDFDGKPCYVAVEGQPTTIDIHKKFPYANMDRIVADMNKLAFTTGFNKGFAGLREFVQENKIMLYALIAVALIGLASVYFVYFKVLPGVEEILAVVKAMNAATTTASIVAVP